MHTVGIIILEDSKYIVCGMMHFQNFTNQQHAQHADADEYIFLTSGAIEYFYNTWILFSKAQ